MKRRQPLRANPKALGTREGVGGRGGGTLGGPVRLQVGQWEPSPHPRPAGLWVSPANRTHRCARAGLLPSTPLGSPRCAKLILSLRRQGAASQVPERLGSQLEDKAADTGFAMAAGLGGSQEL